MWIYLIVIPLLGRALYTDFRFGIIENQLITFGFLLGIASAYLSGGWPKVLLGLKTMGIVLIMMMSLYLIKGLGAGDVKLLCVLATFFPETILQIIIAAFLVGAVIAISKMLWRATRHLPFYIRGETIKFSLAITVGMILSNWMTS